MEYVGRDSNVGKDYKQCLLRYEGNPRIAYGDNVI